MHCFVAEDGEGGLLAVVERDGGGVATGSRGGVPEEFSGVFVEGDAGFVGVEEEAVADDDGCGGKSPGGHGGFGEIGEVGGPAEIAGGFIPARGQALFAEGVEPFPLDDGWGVGPTGVVFWNKILGIVFTPDRFAGGGIEALDEVVAIEVSERVGLPFADGDAGIAEVDLGGPEDLGSAFRPVMGPGGFVIVDAIAWRAPPDAPFRRGREKGEGGGKEEGREFHRFKSEC